MEKRRQKIRTIAAALLICLVFGMGIGAGDLQSGVCEDAVKECFND